LKNDFIIQSCNTFYHKTQNIEDDGFTISLNLMIMDESKYQNMFKQLNEEQKLMFDNIMYRKKMYSNISIHIFLTRGVGIGKTFTLKLIIQGLLQIYKDLSFNLTKIKHYLWHLHVKFHSILMVKQ
jgi:hypothetical protein